MTRKRHTEEQIIAVLKNAQAGIGGHERCRKHGISDATFYAWRTKYAGLEVSDVKKLRQLEDESRRLKQMVAPKAKRTAAQWMAERVGLSQRRVCRLLTLDRNTLRYGSRRQEDAARWTRIREIAESKRRDGCPRIYVRLRREGWRVNHKRVERIYYRDEGLSLWRRRCPRSPYPSPRNQDVVRPWTLSMTSWQWQAVQVFDDDRALLKRSAGD